MNMPCAHQFGVTSPIDTIEVCLHCGISQSIAPPDTSLSKIKDSGKRQIFETGSRRDTREGKGRYDLLPTRALRRIARHFEEGSKKYGDRNWEMGQPLSRYMDSGLRHTLNHLEGQRDEDHISAAVWNLLCLIETEERIQLGMLPKDLNDLPTQSHEFPKQP